MIPKKIHYCWFGGKQLPESAKKCIVSWKKFLPDYEIIEWNESNFDVNGIPYTAEAYAAKKYAFVSDYARNKIIYEQGGIYFDTDVEIIASMDDILARGGYMGFEINPCGQREYGAVASGLGVAAPAQHPIYKQILDYYHKIHFQMTDGSYNMTNAVVNITTRILIENGLQDIPGIQNVNGIFIYPADYFNPLDDATGRLCKTANTRTIHWFTKTWLNISPWRQWIGRIVHRIFGVDFPSKVRGLFKN